MTDDSPLMTHEESGNVPCPLVGIIATLMRSSDQRAEQKMAYAPCGGAGCVMWRWYDSKNIVVTVNPTARPDRRGYCGLAGKPDHED